MTGLAGGPVRVGPVLGMRVIIGVPSPLTRKALNHALEALTRINVEYLRAHPGTPSIYDGGVQYGVEPEGFELWDPIPLILARGVADCDDLGTARAAELRVSGEDPDARADCYPSRIHNGRRTWHCITVRGDGTVEDPSARLGMRVRPGHILDGQPFVDVVEDHAHLEGVGEETFRTARARPTPQREERVMSHVLKWEVRPLPGGGYQGTVWFAREARAPLHSVTQAAPTPGDAIEHAFDAAQHTAHALEAAGLDLGSLIPGLLTTGADLVRTFTGSPTAPPPSSAPPQWQQLATTAMMRAPQYMPAGYAMPAPQPYFAPPPPAYAYK